MSERLRLGDMLMAAGMVTEAQVQEALARQKTTGRRLGETLVSLGHVTEAQMSQILSNQLTVPWVNLYHVDFSRELLDLVPSDIAEEYCLVPVYIRHVRRQGDTLYVAMDDPLNFDALQLVADCSKLPVKPMVAPPTDIRNAIRVYYLGLPALTPEAPAEHVAAEESSPSMQIEEIKEEELEEEQPPEPKKPSPRFVTLTLLDGTQVRLPAPSKKSAEPERSGLTTRDLIHALLARASGKDVSHVLAEDDWEPLLAALLSLLLRKGLVADWEFVDEWQKHRKSKKDT